MKPVQVASILRTIATRIDNSRKPDKRLVSRDLKNVIAAMTQTAAQLVIVKAEPNPDNDAGSCLFAYFNGTPSEDELEAAGGGKDGFTVPERMDDEVSKKAGLERWLLTQNV